MILEIAFSNNFTILLISDGPKPVETVNATAVTDTSANIVWTPSSVEIDDYIVKVVGGGETITRNVSGDATSLDILGLKERTNYNVTVVAVKDGKPSTADAFSFRTLSDGK